MGLTRLEQETIITFNVEESMAVLWTADPVWIRKMDKLVENNPNEFKQTGQETMDGVVVQKRYEMPKKLVNVRAKSAVGRKMTDEERELAAERLRQARNKKSSTAKTQEPTT